MNGFVRETGLRVPPNMLPFFRRLESLLKNGAGDGARTRHLSLGKAALYQMSYSRRELVPQSGVEPRHRDFQSLLYQLSYRGKNGDPEGARTPDLQRDRLAY